jgi:hypothetical protein
MATRFSAQGAIVGESRLLLKHSMPSKSTIKRAALAATVAGILRLMGLVIILFAMPLLLVPQAAMAASQDAEATAPSNDDGSQDTKNQPENNGEDFTRPQNLIQLRDSYETSPGTAREVDRDTFTLRADRYFDLASKWRLALRVDVPFVAKNPINSENPDGDFIYGLGDMNTQAVLVYTFDSRWAGGFGLRLFEPTGQENLSSEKWRLMPIVGVRAMLPEISTGSFFEGVVRYDQSVAGDPSAKTISNLQLWPMLNFGLPDQWFFTLYPSPDIRVNFGDPITGQTGRLFLPFDALIGRKLTKNMNASLEVGVPIIKDYPVYDFKTVARLTFSY